MGWVLDSVGQKIAHYLEKPAQGYEPFTPSDPDALRATLRPGDVLLVEGNNHISGVIKYLTQSTWSHSALYVGRIGDRETEDGEPLVLVEANIGQGVVAAPLSKYFRLHTRICRPAGLSAEDCARVCAYATERIGFDYDLKNITDLMRYLMPLPVPQRWRRSMMALGSGHPTRIICSALIAQAFETVRYPILPKVTPLESEERAARDAGDPPLLALRAARLRHLALFRGGEADHRERLRLQASCTGPTCQCRRPSMTRRRLRWNKRRPAPPRCIDPPSPLPLWEENAERTLVREAGEGLLRKTAEALFWSDSLTRPLAPLASTLPQGEEEVSSPRPLLFPASLPSHPCAEEMECLKPSSKACRRCSRRRSGGCCSSRSAWR